MVQEYRELHQANVPLERSFSASEYEARLANIREAMAERDIDVLLIHHTPNSCYLFGYQSPLANWYGCFILPREGEPIAQVMIIEIMNLMVHGWPNENIYTFDWRKQIDAPGQLVDILKERGFDDKRLGLEFRLPGCSGQTSEALRQGLPNATIVDASDLVLDFRAVKSPAEMEVMRHSARLTDIGMEAGLATIAAGNTDNDLLASCSEAMTRAGSEYLSIQPLVYVGHATSMIHLKTSERRMREGDPVGIEISANYKRYGAPLFRAGVVGEASDTIKRFHQYSVDTLELLGENLRPGRTAADVARSVHNGMKKRTQLNSGEVGTDIGYGYFVGISFPPDWVEHSMFVDEDHDRELEEGMCFHSPIGASIPGKLAVFVSECWTITATGAEPLSKLPRDLTVGPA